MSSRRTMPALLAILFLFCAAVSLPAADTVGNRKVKVQIDPVYPDVARTMNISGTVRVQVTITAQGAVKDTKVIGGHPLLADSAVRAIQRWKYEPGPEETTVVSFEFKR